MTTTDTEAPGTEAPEPVVPANEARPFLRLADGILAASIVVQAVVAWRLGRKLWWFSDDWNIITRYAHGELLEPFNGHLSIIPVGIFRFMFEVIGLEHYGPYRVVGLACYFGFGVVLYAYGRRQAPPLVAVLGTLLLLWLSVAGFNLTFPFLINFTIPLAATVGCWWLLEVDTPRRNVLSAVLLGIALASSGLGVVTAIAIATELAWKRAPLRRWLPHAVPVGLWACWYVVWSESAGGKGALGDTLTYFRHEIQATFWAAGATNRAIGAVVFVAFVGLLVAAWRWGTFDARVVSALVAFLAFTGLTAFSRVGIIPRIPPDTGRYLWVNIVYLLAAAFACLRGRRVHVLVVVALAALVLANAVVLVRDLQDHDQGVAQYADTVRVHLLAAELGRGGDQKRILPLSMLPVTVGAYHDAVDAYGSPIHDLTPDQLGPGGTERDLADRELVDDLGLHLEPAVDGCTTSGSTSDQLEVPAGSTVAITAGATDAPVRLGRISEQPAVGLAVVPAGTTQSLRLPDDADAELGARFPWTIVAPGAELTACR
ncbi:hypothetical protein [Aquihabitans sp. McL0605]|uniref:hypothetical protein n=1 Tax=Aquihabitans sp. McL0605 TaxID=3415671 RepID=UPI003CF3F127